VQVVNDQYAGILYTGEIGRFSKYKAWHCIHSLFLLQLQQRHRRHWERWPRPFIVWRYHPKKHFTAARCIGLKSIFSVQSQTRQLMYMYRRLALNVDVRIFASRKRYSFSSYYDKRVWFDCQTQISARDASGDNHCMFVQSAEPRYSVGKTTTTNAPWSIYLLLRSPLKNVKNVAPWMVGHTLCTLIHDAYAITRMRPTAIII
jgi:hypothetical protein